MGTINLYTACRPIAVLAATVCFADTCQAAESSEVAATVTIRVAMPDGTPAANVPVQVVGLERVGQCNRPAGTTDKDGGFTVPLMRGQREWEAPDLGYGVYRFVVMPEGHAWQLSDIFHWNESAEDVEGAFEPGPGLGLGGFSKLSFYTQLVKERESHEGPLSNWTHAKAVPISFGANANWEVRLDPGTPMTVRVVDGGTLKPVAGATVGQVLYFNSMAQGGPIGETDADGRFSTDNACTDHVQGGFVEKAGYESARFDMDAAADQEEIYVALYPVVDDKEAADKQE